MAKNVWSPLEPEALQQKLKRIHQTTPRLRRAAEAISWGSQTLRMDPLKERALSAMKLPHLKAVLRTISSGESDMAQMVRRAGGMPWTDAEHPRAPAGSPKGGEWVTKVKSANRTSKRT